MNGYRLTYDEISKKFPGENEHGNSLDVLASSAEVALKETTKMAIEQKSCSDSKIVFKRLEVVFTP